MPIRCGLCNGLRQGQDIAASPAMTGSNRLCHAAFSPRPLASITRSSLFKELIPTRFNSDCFPLRTLAQPHFLFILFAICHDANYIPLPACVTFALFLKDSRSEFVVQCKEWTLSRSMLRKFSQGDGALKAVVQAFLRSRLNKKKIVATAMIAGPSARFRDIRPMVK